MFKFEKHAVLGKKNSGSQENSIELKKSLDYNISIFKEIFNNDDTIVFKNLENQNCNTIKCCVIFTDGMADSKIISETIIKPLIHARLDEGQLKDNMIDTMKNKIITSGKVLKTSDVNEITGSILYGNTALMIDGIDEVLIVSSPGFEKRAISEPLSEKVVRGPREGFTESVIVNTSLIRRRIKNSDLKFTFRELGTRTKTKICVCYIKGVASEKVVREVNHRLDKIHIDGILESGYIEDMIKDRPLSSFQTTGFTERPDVVAGKLLEGRVAIICDGSPFVITVPYLFIEYFQTNEDYYREFIFSSFNRLLRMFGFFLTVSVPAIYISLVTYHQEVLQTPLLLSISASREGIPFPTVVEALIMTFVFEVLREAGIRLPTPIGQAISIVGALVLGEAAVNARFASAPIVIVIALTGITSFLIPKIVGPAIIVRMIFIILSSVLGLYGYIFGVLGLLIRLISIRSFGAPYMLGEGTISTSDIQDTFIRVPWWLMYYRPRSIYSKDIIRKSYSRSNGRG